ncbi:hypothetical protein GCM10007315_00050 [Gemmobacter tilapiae]|uniref:DNA-binding protein n=2 Tax=Neogemmobacter tilapiae TaxID=875041 RepID=A0A918WE61_9RHOB|nr:hypothetical protein GCM10007315_00050 [Gemmobacter tilapiae]
MATKKKVEEPVQAEGKSDGAGATVTRVGDLIDAVVTATGAKKPQAKPVVEATLTALGLLLADGQELNLPGLGKLQVMRRKERPNGEVIIVKLRRPGEKAAGEKKAKTPLAPAPEES